MSVPDRMQSGDVLRLIGVPREASVPPGWTWIDGEGWVKVIVDEAEAKAIIAAIQEQER